MYRLPEERETNNFYILLEVLFPDYIEKHSNEDLEKLIDSFEDDLMSLESISINRFELIFLQLKQRYDEIETNMFLLYVLLCNRSAQDSLDWFHH